MTAEEFLEADTPSAVPSPTPVTFFTIGADAGGPDESQDKWTNRGYSATGKNLTPGVAAVNTARYPLGTVFRDTQSGQVFLAADKHGNRDANVVDLYVDPQDYKRAKVTRNFEIIGEIAKIPATVEGVREVLSKFGSVPAGGEAKEPEVRKATAAKEPEVRKAIALTAEEFLGGEDVTASMAAEDFLGTAPVADKAQAWWKNWLHSLGRGATSEGVLMAAQGLYGAVSQGTKGTAAEGLFEPSKGQEKAAKAMRDTVREALPVDEKFATSLTGQILQGVGQLVTIPAYVVPGFGEALTIGQLYQEAKDDYSQTRAAQGKPADDAEAHRAAVQYLAGAAPLEVVTDRLILGKALKRAAGKVTVGELAKTFGKLAAVGGATEGAQQGWLNTIAKELEGYDPERKLTDQVAESVVVGAVVSGGAGAAAQAVAPEAPTLNAERSTLNAQGQAARVDTSKLEGATAQAQFEDLLSKAGGTEQGVASAAPPEAAVQSAAEFLGGAPTPAAKETAGVSKEDPFALGGEVPQFAEDYVEGGDAEAIAAAAEDARQRAEYRQELEAARRAALEESGSMELLEAIQESGGLPGRGSHYETPYSGELKMVRENAGRTGAMKLFRKNAPDPDRLVTSLRDRGFDIEGPNQLWDLLDARLRTGKELWGDPAKSQLVFAKAADPQYRAVDQQWWKDFAEWRQGKFQKPRVFKFGTASDELILAGFPDAEIIMGPRVLEVKPSSEKHPFPVEKLFNLPKRLRDPIAVFKSRTVPDARTVLTEIEYEGENILAAVHFKPTQDGKSEISSVQSVYPKDTSAVVGWINDGLATYYHKEKARGWLSLLTRGSNSPVGRVQSELTPGSRLFQQTAGSSSRRAWLQLQATANVKTNEDVVKGGTAFSKSVETGSVRTGFLAHARQIATAMQAEMPRGPRIEVVESTTQLAGQYDAETAASLVAEHPQAFYDYSLDRVVLITENFVAREGESLPEHVRRLVMHEAAGHGGLARLFEGPMSQDYGLVIAALYKRLRTEDFGDEWASAHGYRTLEELAQWYGYNFQEPEGAFRTIEEHLARLAEHPQAPRWFDQVIAAITAILRKHGFSAWTDADTRILLARARDQLGMQPGRTTVERGGLRFSKTTEQLAADAANEGPLRVLSADGKNTFANVQLRGLADIKIIEMPEMIGIARELTGADPQLRRMRSALGIFAPQGEGQIRLDPRIFEDASVAAKVLAHEIGHLADWLPNKTLKRGNLIGRLYTLKNHLQKSAFGSTTGIKEKAVRAELEGLTQWWAPWDEGAAPDWYNKYRKSSKELYADAISVLFNSPAELKARAPIFYREFFAWLDKKPEVKQAFFEVQAFLHKPYMEVLRARAGRVHGMFGKAEEVYLRHKERARQWKLSTRGLIDALKEQFYDRFHPITKRQTEAEAAGAEIPPELDMRKLFDEHPLADNLVYTWLNRVFERVVQPLEAAEITLEDLGEYLFFSRVMADRAGVANPGGHTPQTSRMALTRMRLDLGIRKFTLLERGAEQFHDYVFETVKEAADAGLIAKETFKTVIEPNRGTYAAFRPIDHVEDYVPAGIYQQVGTLKEIENPWFTTILKTIALRRAIQHHRARVGAVQFLQEFFPGEIKAADTVWDGKKFATKPVKDPKERGLIEVREDGKWAAYEVPSDVAKMFERVDPSQANAAIRTLNWVFRKGFYPLWVRFNPVFQLAYSPIRDAQRFYVNMPRAGALKLAGEYLRALPAAAGRLMGKQDPLVTEMYETLALATPHDSFARNLERDDAFEEVLRQFHILPREEQSAWRNNMVARPALAFLRAVEFIGQTLEAAPKIAAYKVLAKDLGWTSRDAASYVRNYIGVPNYLRKGRHAFAAGSVIPFWNVAVQGLSADVSLARGKEQGKSAASWWLRWALAGGMYAILQGLARNGALGEDAQKWFGGVSDYDNTNYLVIPFGTIAGGNFGQKSMYLRIPQDEMHRVTNGLMKKFIDFAFRHANDEAVRPLFNDVLEIGSYAGGQLPGFNPLLAISGKWGQYAAGLNPYDIFRGRHVLSNTEWLAGGWESTKPMLAMTINDSGIGNFYRYNPEADTTTEFVIRNSPLVQRLFKISDTGLAETQERTIERGRAEDARLRTKLPRNAATLATEHNFLRNLGRHRSPEQESRYRQLREWHKRVYTPTMEAAEAERDAGYDPAETLGGLKESSQAWE